MQIKPRWWLAGPYLALVAVTGGYIAGLLFAAGRVFERALAVRRRRACFGAAPCP